MRTVSDNFRKAINNGGPFYAYAEVDLANGTQLIFDSTNDFYISGNKYNHSFSDAFPIGEAVCKTINLKIYNTDNQYSAKDFEGATITLYTEIDGDDNTPERLLEGIFNVLTANAINNTIEISAADNMCKMDKPLKVTSGPYFRPATTREAASTICTACGLTLATPNFRSHRITGGVQDGVCTYREYLGYIAQLAGGNAFITPEGEVAIKSYTRMEDEPSYIVSGGVLEDSTPDIISGGEFGTTVEDSINSNEFGTTPYIVLNRYTTAPQIGVDEITITGVSFSISTTDGVKTYQYGADGYVLNLKNLLLAPTPESVISNALEQIGEYVIGRKIRPFSGKFSANPSIELMDNVYLVNVDDNVYSSIITSLEFNYLGDNALASEIKSTEAQNFTYATNNKINDSYFGTLRARTTSGQLANVNVIDGKIKSVVELTSQPYSGTISYKKSDNTTGNIVVEFGIITSVT